MEKFQFVFGLTLLLSLGLIRNVNGDCTNSDGSTCSGTDCCYDGTNGLSPVLGSGGGISPIQECYTTGSGNGVTYTCTGELRGPPFNDCYDGTWQFPFAPTCDGIISCTQPTVPTDGSVDPDTPTYDRYTRVTYACDDGYTLGGPSEAVCETGGGWNPSTVPTCEANCAKPTLTNGGVIPDQDSFSNGEVLDYECNTNYTLVGVSTATCRNGVYDPSSKPTCYANCVVSAVPDSDYSSGVTATHGTTFNITCDAGFSTGTTRDTEFSCNNGDLSPDTLPTCYANCPPLDDFDNGVRSGDSIPFYHNEQVSYTCNNGFTLVGSTSLTCGDGDWNDNQPVCLANCVVSAVPDSDYSSGVTVTHGTTFNITCDAGFSTGTTRATEFSCNDGDLSPDTLPTCYDVNGDCTNSDGSTCSGTDCCYDGTNGLSPVLGSGGGITPIQECYTTGTGNGVTYTCTGDLRGPPFNDCLDGTWQFPFAPTCEGVNTCPQPTIPTDGSITPDTPTYDLYTRITYACDDGYTLGGPSEAVCESGGVWNPSTVPTCESNCAKPTLDNGGVIPDQDYFSNGEVLIYECNTNYALYGVSTTTCRGGVYDPPTQPICYNVASDCINSNGVPCTGTDCCYDGANGLSPVLGSGGAITPIQECYTSGSGVTYTCSGDLTGPPFNTCNGGTWQYPFAPTCEGLDVFGGYQYVFYHGTVSRTYRTFSQTRELCQSLGGDMPIITSAEQNDFIATRLTEGDGNYYIGLEDMDEDDEYRWIDRTALRYTNWDSPLYTHPPPYCAVMRSRSSLTDPIHGRWNRVTCTSTRRHICQIYIGITACPQPTVPAHGSISRITYACDDGYTLGGPSEAVCESGGVWNPSTVPTCEADCAKPILTNGGVTPDQDYFSSGEVLTYQCNTDYTLVGVSTAVCSNGVYDPPTKPTCLS